MTPEKQEKIRLRLRARICVNPLFSELTDEELDEVLRIVEHSIKRAAMMDVLEEQRLDRMMDS